MSEQTLKNSDEPYVWLWPQSTFLRNLIICRFHAIFFMLVMNISPTSAAHTSYANEAHYKGDLRYIY